MRIEKLIIEKFGMFDSREFGPLSAKVNLLYGRNEAGKSTLAAFVRDILFGFPTRTNRRSSENDYEAGEISGSGGRVIVSSEKNGELIISRKYINTRVGELSLLDTSGGKLPESVLESILGGIGYHAYRHIYAFDLTELAGLDTGNETLRESLYSVGAGVSGLDRKLEEWEKEAGELFKARGTKPEINSLLSQLDSIEEQIKSLRTDTTEYARLENKLKGFQDASLKIGGQKEIKQSRQRELQSYLDAGKYLSQLKGKEAELAALEKLPEGFPENSIEQLAEHDRNIKAAKNRIEEFEQRKETISDAFAERPELDKLMPHSEEIAHLKERESEYRNLDTQVVDIEERKEYLEKKQKSSDTQKSFVLAFVAAIFIVTSIVIFSLVNKIFSLTFLSGISLFLSGISFIVWAYRIKIRKINELDNYDICTLEKQLNAKLTLHEEYNERAAAILDIIGQKPDSSFVGSTLDIVLGQYTALQKYRQEKENLGQRIRDLDELVEQEKSKLKISQRDKLSYLKKYTSSELYNEPEQMEAELNRLATLQQQRKTLAAEIENTRGKIATLGESSGREGTSFLEYLQQADMEKLAGEKKLIDEEISTLDAQLEIIIHDSGSTEYEMKEIREREARALELISKREQLKAELDPLVERWCALKIARKAADSAREVFEREHQPELTRIASGIFRGMTDGRYENVRALIGGEQITVVGRDGRSLEPEKLSRGTAEQLYLALRFAYIIQRANSNNEPLPVIMDDILVNFDSGRAATAVGEIERISESHQVLYFTCHSHVKEMFEKEIAGVNVIEL